MIKTVKNYLIPHEGNSYKPHLLREKAITGLFVLGFILFCTSLGSSYILNKTDFGAAVLPAVLVDLTNEHRIENGQKILQVSPVLESAALMKAKDMAENHYFAHTSPSGVTPWQWFIKAGYNFIYAGENLAVDFDESLDVENAWIASPTHHANLISSKFDEVGIATYQGFYEGRPTTFVVQLFGKPAKAKQVLPIVEKITPEKKASTLAASATPTVKGESAVVFEEESEPAPVLLIDEPKFAVAQNIAEVEAVQSIQNPMTKYATFGERLLVKQAKYVQYAYLALMILVYLVLLCTIVVEFRIQHPKNIALGVLLLCFLGVLAYLNSSFVLSFF